jgi:hypothetical protein
MSYREVIKKTKNKNKKQKKKQKIIKLNILKVKKGIKATNKIKES